MRLHLAPRWMGFLLPQQADGQTPHRSQVGTAVSILLPTRVFAERHVENPMSGKIEPTILIDRTLLMDRVASTAVNRTKTCLILHEIFHLRHWKDLFPTESSQASAAEALPEHEAEAWWFCYTLLGHVIALCAYEKKNNPGSSLKPTWELVGPAMGE